MKVQRWQTIQKVFLPFLVTLFFAACGGGGGGGGPSPVASLQGTWGGGAFIDSVGNRRTEVDVNGSGQITDIRFGGVSSEQTGTIAHVQDNIFSFTLSDGTEGGFMTDASRTHAGFLDEEGSFGALQKGADGPAASYSDADIQNNWSGYSVELGIDLGVTASGSSSATHNGANSFTVTDMNGTANAVLTVIDATNGEYFGTWDDSVNSGPTRAWVSQDKTFAASWACTGFLTNASTFPSCTFAIWTKQ